MLCEEGVGSAGVIWGLLGKQSAQWGFMRPGVLATQLLCTSPTQLGE